MSSRKNLHIPAIRFANNTEKIICPYYVHVSKVHDRVPRKIVHIVCLKVGRNYKNSTMECRQLYYHTKVKFVNSSDPRAHEERVRAGCVGYNPQGIDALNVEPRIQR
jgi:AmiR/NasT family two-component response regulator